MILILNEQFCIECNRYSDHTNIMYVMKYIKLSALPRAHLQTPHFTTAFDLNIYVLQPSEHQTIADYL